MNRQELGKEAMPCSGPTERWSIQSIRISTKVDHGGGHDAADVLDKTWVLGSGPLGRSSLVSKRTAASDPPEGRDAAYPNEPHGSMHG